MYASGCAPPPGLDVCHRGDSPTVTSSSYCTAHARLNHYVLVPKPQELLNMDINTRTYSFTIFVSRPNFVFFWVYITSINNEVALMRNQMLLMSNQCQIHFFCWRETQGTTTIGNGVERQINR